MCVVTSHQFRICALVSQTSFGGETSGSVAKCRLFSQATENLVCAPLNFTTALSRTACQMLESFSGV